MEENKGKLNGVKDSAREFGRKAWAEAKRFGSNAARFARENKEALIVGAPVAIAAIRSGQSLIVNRRVKQERKRIDHTWYDPRTGMHWDLKRKVSNAERAEILRRRGEGQDAYTILRQMRLIK